MRVRSFKILLFLLLSISASAQEETSVAVHGKRYIQINTQKLEKYNSRVKRQQQHLLKKLVKKEKKLTRQLKSKDSAAYAQLSTQPLTYDSINRLARPDSATLARKNRRGNKAIDSLKAVESFVSKQSNSLYGNSPTDGINNGKLNELQGELNYHNYINDLIAERSNSIKNVGSRSKGRVAAFTSIEKNVFYSKQKLKAIKDIADEPTKIEERALEYLQGTEGFENTMSKVGEGPGSMKGMSGNMTVSELERMGFQTKRQMQNSLTEKFGKNTASVAQKMGSQVKEFQDKGKEVTNTIKDGKKDIGDTKKTVKETKKIEKPSFKVNPMRGRLFWQRTEKQYNFQTTRATLDRPAMLEVSAMAGFKHTPKLTYGLGVASSFGLGQGWNNIKISLEGVGLRSYAQWQWQYGIGAYAGYERIFKRAVFIGTENPVEASTLSSHNTGSYSESVLVGLTKSYNVNAKYNGAVQLLYDIWWREKGLRSPIVLRFSTQSK